MTCHVRYTATKNHKKLKSLYQKALQIKSAIPHPKVRQTEGRPT